MEYIAKSARSLLLIIFVLLALVLPSPQVVAQQLQGGGNVGGGGGGGNVGGGGGGIQNPIPGVTDIADLFLAFANYLLGLVVVLALIGVIWGGIRMVIASGDENAIANAKRIVFWSVAGLAVALLSLTIINIVICEALGISDQCLGGGAFRSGGTQLAQYLLTSNTAQAIDTSNLDALPRLSTRDLAGSIVNFLSSIAALVALAVFIWGAFRYMTSLGDEQKAESAKRVMLYAVVGLFLVGAAYVVIRLVGNLLGLDNGGA